MAGEYNFSDLLKQFRVRERMSQQQLAEYLGVHRNTIGAWERGDWLPDDRPRVLKLAETLRLSQQDTDTLLQASVWQSSQEYQDTTAPVSEVPLPPFSVSALPLVSSWNVPHRRNPFFTGRQDLLKRLRSMLTSEKAAALTQTQAISGLGGIGKTQTAVEYAYRYQGDYKTILWARADSRETLVSDFVSIAHLLKLPEKDEQDQSRVVNACKHWLNEYADWLLILDNADDLALTSDFIPAGSQGHTLLTTREQVAGTIARRIELATMKPEEGALFLLRRTQLLAMDAPPDNASRADWTRAREISRLMDGLPLALDQVGAYIEATACGLAGYQERYKTQRAKLLKLRGKAATYDHPEPVATTWSLSFERVQRANPAAADLLRLCAFLHPDAIPEEIITAGASNLGPALQSCASDLVELDSAISELRRYSLLRRDPETQTLGIHRLVQAVLQDALFEAERRAWAERAVLAVNAAFPDTEYRTWSQCERLLPHALLVVEYIKTNPIISEETGRLLHETARYLYERAQYPQAEPLYQRALRIREQQLGPEHPNTARSLNSLALLYQAQGQYEPALPLFQRALAIREQALEPNHPDIAASLNDLALLYQDQGLYQLALPLYQRALAIREQALSPVHPDMAESLDNLASLYQAQGQYEPALPLFQRALAIREQTLFPDHPQAATSLNNLAELYRDQGQYELALPLHQRALAIREQALGPEHPHVATSLSNLASLYYAQGRYDEALLLLQRALVIDERTYGLIHPEVATDLNNLARLYQAQGQYELALPLHQRALMIREQVLGPKHPQVAISLNNLALLYQAQGQYEPALPLLQQALAVREHALGPDNPDVATSLSNLANLYREQGKYGEAELLHQRALRIREQHFGSEHSQMAYSLNDLAELYQEQGKHVEAEPLFQRALRIWEQQLGSEHPNVAETMHDLAQLREAQGNRDEARPWYEQALAIREHILGPEHPKTKETRKRYITFLREMGQYDEAASIEAMQSKPTKTGEELERCPEG